MADRETWAAWDAYEQQERLKVRQQGLAGPEGVDVYAVTRLMDNRNPGLRSTLKKLRKLLSPGSASTRMYARALVPYDAVRRLRPGQRIEDVSTRVSVEVSDPRGVRILHQIISMGLYAYTTCETWWCRHCGEPVDTHAMDLPDPWWHRATGEVQCADGVHTAELSPECTSSVTPRRNATDR